MTNDPFARFERSSGGWLIPLTIFVLGAIATWWGVRSLARLQARQFRMQDRVIVDEDEKPELDLPIPKTNEVEIQ